MDNDHRQYEQMRSLQGSFEEAIGRWEFISRDEKHGLLQIFVERIEVVEVQVQGEMRLRIIWRDNSQEEVRVNRKPTYGQGWTQDEVDELLALVDEGASQVEIAATFPTRQWQQIRLKLRNFRKDVIFSPICLNTGRKMRLFRCES
jgi:hypothetical protein